MPEDNKQYDGPQLHTASSFAATKLISDINIANVQLCNCVSIIYQKLLFVFRLVFNFQLPQITTYDLTVNSEAANNGDILQECFHFNWLITMRLTTRGRTAVLRNILTR